ncbi:type VI secretion system ATPase TssH, partial [bacterium]|nr:type VI secretion system ATPase TssH [bacterium]
MTFDKLTLKGQEAFGRAQQAASESGHQQVEVEHLLKALLEDSDGVPVAILKKLGTNVDQVLTRLQEEIQKIPRVSGPGAVGGLYVSNRLNNLFNVAQQE